jgi:type III restriction enzyme
VDLTGGTLTFTGSMNAGERNHLKSCLSKAENKEAIDEASRKEAIDEASRKVQQKTSGRVKAPAEEGAALDVPQLAIEYDGQYEVFRETHLYQADWKLSDREATLPRYDGPRRARERAELDTTTEGKLQIRYIDRVQRQMTLLDDERGWSVPALVRWLDRKIPHRHFTQQDVGIFLNSLIQDYLIDDEGFALDELVRDKYRLRRFIEDRIREHQEAARSEAHKQLLDLDHEPPVTVRPDVCFSFSDEYPCNCLYNEKKYKFDKHYYRKVGDFDSGEEEDCAAFIDRQPEVVYWVRNLTKPRFSFWLQTATDRFYPDFVCKLHDGRHLVVEYKGADRWGNPENTEKRNLGQLWEARSNGQCLFVMPEGPDHDTIGAKMR